MIYLIEKLWYDSMENRNAYGWSCVGYVEDLETAILKSVSEYIQVSESPWPLEYVNLREKPTELPLYRYKEVEKL